MGGTCSTYGGEERHMEGFFWGGMRERDNLEDPGVDGDNIKMDLQKVGCGGMDWIELACDRDR
jgi:hypothetical protein